ncbi:MAG: hypothetical protein IKC49_02805 [Clostridia bacterium]|nr:hypothetical protein [Clostridia bacterium]
MGLFDDLRLRILDKQHRMDSEKRKDTIENLRVPGLVISNKIVGVYNDNYLDKAPMTLRKLNRLILLVEVCFMQKYGKVLIKEDYLNTKMGLITETITSKHLNSTDNSYVITDISSDITQEDAEEVLGISLNIEINDIVNFVLSRTAYIDSVDLAEISKIEKYITIPTSICSVNLSPTKKKMLNEYVVPKDLIYQAYKNFDFSPLAELNEESKKFWNQYNSKKNNI